MAGHDTLRKRRAELEGEWSRRIATRRPASAEPAPGRLLRSEIVESWDRSLRLVDPLRDSAPSENDMPARWVRSPLHRPVIELADELRTIGQDAGFITAVTDESGTILWTFGGRVMRGRAERVNFAPGGRWDETGMGTNALSLALRDGRPAAVFSAEHLVEALHGWVCYSAPIRSPAGRTLGVLDLSSTWDRSNPLAMSTVRTLVSMIESRLVQLMPAAAPDGVRLTCLGGGQATRSGRPLALRPRQLEVAVREAVLAADDPGLALLYGERHPFDVQVHEHASRLLPAHDGRRGLVAARVRAATGG